MNTRLTRAAAALVVAASVAVAVPAVAQQATTQPATRPAAGMADQSTPKGTMLAFYRAYVAGDAEAMRATIDPDDATGQQLMRDTVPALQAQAALEAAMQERYGEPAYNALGGAEEMEQQIEAAVVEVDGDRATLSVSSDATDADLRRRDGKWYLHFGDSGGDTMTVEQNRRAMTALAEALTSLAERVAGGEYESADDANLAIQEATTAAFAEGMAEDEE